MLRRFCEWLHRLVSGEEDDRPSPLDNALEKDYARYNSRYEKPPADVEAILLETMTKVGAEGWWNARHDQLNRRTPHQAAMDGEDMVRFAREWVDSLGDPT
jgi:hypothetical protein